MKKYGSILKEKKILFVRILEKISVVFKLQSPILMMKYGQKPALEFDHHEGSIFRKKCYSWE